MPRSCAITARQLNIWSFMSLRRKSLTLACAFTVCACIYLADSRADARDQIHIVGSGTVYPFTTMVAEQFGQIGTFKTPIVEATGTGGGFKVFCQGIGADKADINDASRKITDSEKALCEKNGVTDIAEITIGYDGIILANRNGAPSLNLTKKQIFMALARLLPDKTGTLVPNRYQTWNEIDHKLPSQPIEIYGPGTVSGTRDAFAEMVMEKGCEQFHEFAHAYPDEKTRKKVCQNIREDGKYIESGEDYNIMVQKLTGDDRALGIFGFSFYIQNPGKIQACKIEGVEPAIESIASGHYGISRSLYVYVKKQHIGLVPGIAEFIKELTSTNAIGAEGYVISDGLIPLKPADLKASQVVAASLVPHK